jgi:lactoylglutathione lyase
MEQLKAVVPVSDEDTNALPVKDIGPAAAFYEGVLGFSVISRDSSAAILTRDQVRIGLVRKADHQPGKAGSLAFAVDDLDAMHRELRARGGTPGEFGVDEWGGEQYRTFFLREDENGYCYCFYHPARDDEHE